jgi:(2Fe-2S) ferredoxin
MNSSPVPYRRMIFVCMNASHDDDRPACGAKACTAKVLETLKDEVKKRGLKGKVRVLKSGCMDLCEKGPNVMVFPEGILHTQVTSQDIPDLISTYLV